MKRTYDLKKAQEIIGRYDVLKKFVIIYDESEIFVLDRFELDGDMLDHLLLEVCLHDYNNVHYGVTVNNANDNEIIFTIDNMEKLTNLLKELKETIVIDVPF